MADIKKHPCWRDMHNALGHRSGGFGNTCERCGTPLGEDDGESAEFISWEPVKEPQPFAPQSLERRFYDRIRQIGAPVHVGWVRVIAEELASLAALEGDE